jgi:hypothetical protein
LPSKARRTDVHGWCGGASWGRSYFQLDHELGRRIGGETTRRGTPDRANIAELPELLTGPQAIGEVRKWHSKQNDDPL